MLDDYAYKGFAPQKAAMDAFAARKDVTICSLPTGQGLMLKPPTASALADSERSDTQVRLPR